MPSENNEISRHEILVYDCLRAHTGRWLSNNDVAAQLAGSGVSARTVRHHTVRLVAMGLLDLAEVFPAHRFRFSEKAPQRNASYLLRLERAAEALGLRDAATV